jgi:transposase-like protein
MYVPYLKVRAMAKRFSARGISKHRSYTVEEAAQIIGACPQTLRKWGNEGLHLLTCMCPHLVNGADLIAFLQKRDAKRKGSKLKIGQVRCFKCKANIKPLGLMADYIPMTPTRGRLTALCADCESTCSLFIGQAKLAQYAKVLD